MASIYTKRLTKELKDLSKNPPEGVAIEEADNLKKWRLRLIGAPGTIYEGEQFKLEFRFTPQYPLEAPEVIFIQPYVPIHPQLVTCTDSCSCMFIHHINDFELHQKGTSTR
ncbi:MAG: ubiquitin-conjugating enzyme/RWD-like protein [Benjaminiella poitrasii]|nr:MAG: ubiquitin-conjugating enzyme/RWD-like protein [Benjaminiella poitrasii]